MVIIALAAAKGAASAYKRAKQLDQRGAVIAPVEGAGPSGGGRDDDAWDSLLRSQNSGGTAPQGTARPFSTARPSSFDAATSAGRLALGAPPAASAPQLPATVELSEFAPASDERRENAGVSRDSLAAEAGSGSLVHSQSASLPRTIPLDGSCKPPSRPPSARGKPKPKPKPAPVSDGSFNHLRRVQSAQLRSTPNQDAKGDSDEDVDGASAGDLVGSAATAAAVPEQATSGPVILPSQTKRREAAKGDRSIPRHSRPASADVLGSFNHAVRCGAVPSRGKPPKGESSQARVQRATPAKADSQAPGHTRPASADALGSFNHAVRCGEVTSHSRPPKGAPSRKSQSSSGSAQPKPSL